MTRKLLVFFLFAVLALTGCKKIQSLMGKKGSLGTTAATPAPGSAESGSGSGNTTASGDPAPPTPPDINVPAATPAPPPKPAIDTTAGVMALCYHNIEDSSKMKALTITVAEFEKEMEQIKGSGFTVIPMQDFLAWRRGEKSIPRKSCLISIDDGWLSGYTNAWPILKKYGYPFTLYIYVSYVGSGGKSLTWDQLAEMRDAGVDIQCHTYTHSNLHGKGNSAKIQAEIKTMGYEPWLRKEIVESKKILESQLGIKVSVLAYPYGVWNAQARAMVKEAGYEAAFTVYGQRLNMHSPPADLLGRYAVEASKPQIFQSALTMTGGGVTAGEAPTSNVAQLAAVAMITQPMDHETISNQLPLIKANLASMGEVDGTTIDVRLSGVGAVPHKFDPQTKIMTAQVLQPLKPGAYTVIITAKVGAQKETTRWDFAVAGGKPAPAAPAAATPAPAKKP